MTAPAAWRDRAEAGLRRAWPWLGPVLVAGVLGALGWRCVLRPEAEAHGDTAIYRRAAARWVAGEHLYVERAPAPGAALDLAPAHLTNYLYPPALAAASAAWMPWLPYRVVRGAWLVLGVACLGLTVRVGLGLLAAIGPAAGARHPGGGRPGERRLADAASHQRAIAPVRRPALALLLVAPLVARLGWNELAHGQVNAPVALLLTLALARAQAGRDASAGALVGLALAVKPTAWPLVAWWALARRGRLVLACALTGGAAVVLPALRYGLAGGAGLLVDWAALLGDFARRAAAAAGNASLAAALVHALAGTTRGPVGVAPDPVAPLLLGLPVDVVRPWAAAAAALACAGAFAALWRWRRDDPRAPAAVLALAALASPVTWKAHLVVLVAPALCAVRPLADADAEGAPRTAWAVYGLVLLLLVASSGGALRLSTLEALGGLALGVALVGAGAVAGAADAGRADSAPEVRPPHA